MRAIGRTAPAFVAVGVLAACAPVSNAPEAGSHMATPVTPSTPWLVEPASPSPSTTTTPATLPPIGPHARHSYALPDGSVQGSSGRFNYPGVTPAAVDQIEHCGNDTDKILLTFDDSGSTAHIRAIAALLTKNHIGAIFFPNTGRVNQAMFDELRADHFWVGNHTKTHPNLVKMDDKTMQAAITSGGASTLFRPPFGGTYLNKSNGYVYVDSDVIKNVTELGKRTCIWTYDTEDWKGLPATQLEANFAKNIRPGDVVLSHMLADSHILEALPTMIATARQKGLEFCNPSPVPTTIDVPADLHC